MCAKKAKAESHHREGIGISSIGVFDESTVVNGYRSNRVFFLGEIEVLHTYQDAAK